jgi:hypothetical protein
MVDMDLYYLISQKFSHLPMHNFTTEDLLQYLYQETSIEKSAAISEALESDWKLKEAFQLIEESVKNLTGAQYSPRSKTIADIMSYAEKSVETVSQPI